MIRIRKSADRGHADHGWLDTKHTFSFAGYHDPQHMGFRALRVINEDKVAPARGFGTHPHDNMEIVSYVVRGGLTHRDSMGNGSTLRPGDVQRMTAGTGITHSEANPSRDEVGHFLQIWILPERRGLEPGWEEKHFSADDKRGRLRLLVSPDARDGSLRIHQDVELYGSIVEPGQPLEHGLAPDRHAWIQVVDGDVAVNGQRLEAGDGAAVSDESRLELKAARETELLLFDLA